MNYKQVELLMEKVKELHRGSFTINGDYDLSRKIEKKIITRNAKYYNGCNGFFSADMMRCTETCVRENGTVMVPKGGVVFGPYYRFLPGAYFAIYNVVGDMQACTLIVESQKDGTKAVVNALEVEKREEGYVVPFTIEYEVDDLEFKVVNEGDNNIIFNKVVIWDYLKNVEASAIELECVSEEPEMEEKHSDIDISIESSVTVAEDRNASHTLNKEYDDILTDLFDLIETRQGMLDRQEIELNSMAACELPQNTRFKKLKMFFRRLLNSYILFQIEFNKKVVSRLRQETQVNRLILNSVKVLEQNQAEYQSKCTDAALNNVYAEIELLKAERESVIKAVGSLQDDIKEVTGTLQHVCEENRKLQNEVDLLDKRNESLYEESKASIVKLTGEICEVPSMLEKIQKDQSMIKKELEMLDCQDLLLNLKARIDNNDVFIQRLMENINKFYISLGNKEQENVSIKQEVQILKIHQKNINEQFEKVKAQTEKHNEMIGVVLSKNDFLQQEIEKSKRELLTQISKDLSEQISVANRRIDLENKSLKLEIEDQLKEMQGKLEWHNKMASSILETDNSMRNEIEKNRIECKNIKEELLTRANLSEELIQTQANELWNKIKEFDKEFVAIWENGKNINVDLNNIWKTYNSFRKEVFFEISRNKKEGTNKKIQILQSTEEKVMNSEGKVRLNLGCGTTNIDGYIGVDARELPGVDIIADVSALPYEKGTVDEIYSAHLIEHFSKQMLEKELLPYWYSLLKDNGVFRVVFPDTEQMIKEYQNGNVSFEQLSTIIMGAQDYSLDYHYSIHSATTMNALLTQVGFKDIQVIAHGRENSGCFETEIRAVK